MNCNEFLAWHIAEAALEPAALSADARTHLAACTTCQAELQRMRATLGALPYVRFAEPPAVETPEMASETIGATADRLPELVERRLLRIATSATSAPKSHARRWLPPLAAVLSIAAVMLWMIYPNTINKGTAPQTAAHVLKLELLLRDESGAPMHAAALTTLATNGIGLQIAAGTRVLPVVVGRVNSSIPLYVSECVFSADGDVRWFDAPTAAQPLESLPDAPDSYVVPNPITWLAPTTPQKQQRLFVFLTELPLDKMRVEQVLKAVPAPDRLRARTLLNTPELASISGFEATALVETR